MTMMIMRQIKVMTMMTSRILMTMMIIRQMNYDDHNDHETEESIIVLFSVSTQALDTITGLWQTLPDLLVPRLITPYYHLVFLGYHGLSTLLILLINVPWQTLPDLLVPRLITPYYHLAHLGYHGLSTLVILITLLKACSTLKSKLSSEKFA